MLPFLFFGLFACGSETKGSFSTAGDPVNNTSGEVDNSQPTDGPNEDQPAQDPIQGAPVISDLTAFYVDQEGAQLRIEIHAMFEDGEDDVNEGVAIVQYSSDSVSGTQNIDIDGVSAIHEEGEVTILFEPDEIESFSFTLQLQDTAENKSNSMTATADPP